MCREKAMPHRHQDSRPPGNRKTSETSAGVNTSVPQTVAKRARVSRLRDWSGWVLNAAEAAKLAYLYGPFKHTFCGVERREDDPLLATKYPFGQFGNALHSCITGQYRRCKRVGGGSYEEGWSGASKGLVGWFPVPGRHNCAEVAYCFMVATDEEVAGCS